MSATAVQVVVTAPDAQMAESQVELDDMASRQQVDNEPQPPPPPPTSIAAATTRSKAQVAVVMASLCACVFLSALEITIVATALPSIAGHFASGSGYTWIGTSYVLANSASTPSWGKVSDIWGRKPVLLIANVVFLAGSLTCALSGDFGGFIAGRVIQGVGAAGMGAMVNICISDMFSQRDRGLYYGLTSLVWAVASAIGPMIGGAFTDAIGWRWCFWINVPITVCVFALLFFTLKLPSPRTPVWAGLKAIDWAGSLLIVGGTLMLLLGLYLGGVYHPWNSAQVICLIVFGVATAGLFVLNEWKLAEYPVLPVRIFRSWSSAAAYAVCFFHGFVFMGVGYYMPLYFQAVLGANPLRSGVYLLPFVITISISAAITGAYIQFTGKYLAAVHIGLVIMTLGIGLFISLDEHKNWAKLVLFQLLSGIGVGMNFEGPLLAVQAVIPKEDVAAATTAMSFTRTLSTAVSVVIGSVLFQNGMRSQKNALVDALGPNLAELFSGASASAHVDTIKTLPTALQPVVKYAYYVSLKDMWIMYTAFCAVGLVLSSFIRAQHLSKDHETVQLGLRKEAAEASGTSVPGRGSASGGVLRSRAP